MNSYAVDIRRLPENVEMERIIFQSTLTEGAIGYKSLPVNKGYRVMATITLGDGTVPDLVLPVTDTVSGQRISVLLAGGQVIYQVSTIMQPPSWIWVMEKSANIPSQNSPVQH